MSTTALSLDRLRDRAFGVELEFTFGGISGDYGGGCSCRCECSEDYDGCDYCDYGCNCEDDSYSMSRDAADLLYREGFDEWADSAHEDGSGVEISSPILKGKTGLAELKAVVDLLNKHRSYTTESDGLHIHHDAPEFVKDEGLVERLVESWSENADTIDLFIAPYRRGGDYWACQNYFTPQAVADYKAMKGSGDPCNDSPYRLQPGRFSALNISALRSYGTIEFRAHEGTLNFVEIESWLRFGQALLASVARRKCPLPSLDQPEELLRRLRVSPRATTVLLQKAAA